MVQHPRPSSSHMAALRLSLSFFSSAILACFSASLERDSCIKKEQNRARGYHSEAVFVSLLSKVDSFSLAENSCVHPSSVPYERSPDEVMHANLSTEPHSNFVWAQL